MRFLHKSLALSLSPQRRRSSKTSRKHCFPSHCLIDPFEKIHKLLHVIFGTTGLIFGGVKQSGNAVVADGGYILGVSAVVC